MTSQLDNEFNHLNIQKELRWFPWIGENYLKLNKANKLLIIGESHYQTQESIEEHRNPLYTRTIVEGIGINRNYDKTKIFQNLHKALFTNDNFSSNVFWNLVSFYNFIQRPMDTNNGRPVIDDYIKGWGTFFDLVKLLKPQTCLFIGTSSANMLENAIKQSEFKLIGKVIWDEKIGGAFAKSAIISDIDGNEIKLIFIKHTSKMFSWKRWNGYLKQKIDKELNWLESNIQHA
jgi:hypothetical protein